MFLKDVNFSALSLSLPLTESQSDEEIGFGLFNSEAIE